MKDDKNFTHDPEAAGCALTSHAQTPSHTAQGNNNIRLSEFLQCSPKI